MAMNPETEPIHWFEFITQKEYDWRFWQFWRYAGTDEYCQSYAMTAIITVLKDRPHAVQSVYCEDDADCGMKAYSSGDYSFQEYLDTSYLDAKTFKLACGMELYARDDNTIVTYGGNKDFDLNQYLGLSDPHKNPEPEKEEPRFVLETTHKSIAGNQNFSSFVDREGRNLIALFDSVASRILYVYLEDDADVGMAGYGGTYSYEESKEYPWLGSRICEFNFGAISISLGSDNQNQVRFHVHHPQPEFDLNEFFFGTKSAPQPKPAPKQEPKPEPPKPESKPEPKPAPKQEAAKPAPGKPVHSYFKQTDLWYSDMGNQWIQTYTMPDSLNIRELLETVSSQIEYAEITGEAGLGEEGKGRYTWQQYQNQPYSADLFRFKDGMTITRKWDDRLDTVLYTVSTKQKKFDLNKFFGLKKAPIWPFNKRCLL